MPRYFFFQVHYFLWFFQPSIVAIIFSSTMASLDGFSLQCLWQLLLESKRLWCPIVEIVQL
jgi:hypothetical protein